MADIAKFIKDQLSVWPLAAKNFRSIKAARQREFVIGGLPVVVQHNPCRIASSTAQTDAKTLAERPCFLCVQHRPKEQFHLKYEGKKNRLYNIQINPYPIFRDHLVVVRDTHLPQTIWHHFPDMLLFTKMYQDYAVYYNGPNSGASAPDHLHFQACHTDVLPLQKAADAFLDTATDELESVQDAHLYKFNGFTRGVYALKSTTQKSMAKLFYRLLECSPRLEGEGEPRFNLVSWYKGGEFRTVVVLRSNLRSHHYYAQGDEHLTMSPGAADMAGWFVAPREEDLDKLTEFIFRRYKLHFGPSNGAADFLRRYSDGIFRLLDQSYDGLYGTVPFTDAMKKLMIDNFRLVISPKYTAVILDENDRMVCFGFAIPSLASALVGTRGRYTPKVVWRLLRNIRHPKVIDLCLIGVDPEYLNRGVSAAFASAILHMLRDTDVEYAETNLNLEDNYAIQNMWRRFKAVQAKRRRAYVKKLA